jgi:MlaD protein
MHGSDRDSDLKRITSEPTVGKAKPSTRAKWRSSLSACRGVEKKGLTESALLERRFIVNHHDNNRPFNYDGSASEAHLMNWRSIRVAGLIGVVLAALVVLLFARNPFVHKTVVKAYFSNAMSLRAGAQVRLSGVEIGTVKSVRARPEMKEAPAEVVMELTPSYELKIPNDSIASLATAGVLGETYVEIDAAHASGAPIGTNAVLKTIPTTQLSTHEMLEKFGEILAKRCDCDSGRKDDTPDTTARKNVSKNSSQR